MKKNILVILAILCSIVSFAQKATFDIATYNVPKGWKKETKNAYVSYTITNNSKNTYCIISIYASIISKGTATVEFNNDWKELVATPFSITEEPQINTATDKDGREVLSGTQSFDFNEGTSVAMLNTFVGFGRTTSVLALTNDNAYVSTIMDFLKTLTLKKTAPPVATLPKTNPTITTTANNNTTSISNNTATSFTPSNKLEGVWMAMHTKVWNFDKVPAGTIKWVTFFNNGRADKLIPDEGMDAYDKNSSSIGYYTINGSSASLQWFKDVPAIPIKFKTPDQIEFTEPYNNDIYFRCKSVDGVRLQGSWTSFANVNDPELDNNSQTRPLIAFNSNGSFTDYGIFADDFSDPSPPGSGTYDISNFTLTLHYSNGTTKRTSFCGFLRNDVKSNNQMIFIHRLAFHKR